MDADQPRERTCGAKTRSGQACSKLPLRGRTRCRLHGGLSPIGPASPSYKTGRYSKYLPTGLRTQYEAARDDPELLSVRDELALLQVRLGELTARLRGGESGQRWHELQEAFAVLKSASKPEDLKAGLEQLERMIAAGAGDEEQWTELVELIDKKTAVAQKEWGRLVQLRQVITAERAMMLITTLVDMVMKYVPDQPNRLLLSRDIAVLLADGKSHAEAQSTQRDET